MRLPFRGLGAALAALTLLALSLPVVAQGPVSTVTFGGVGFSFDDALGTSVNVGQVPELSADTDPITGGDAQHLAFTIYSPRDEVAKVPRSYEAPAVVRVYRTDDLAAFPAEGKQLEQLRSLLADRPDPATLMAVRGDAGSDALPYLPVLPAAQLVRGRAQYIETPQVSGIAYVTAFAQDVLPFAAGDFEYTFQGLSTDGAWYVAVDANIEAPGFPAKVTTADYRRVAGEAKYARYLAQSIETLNGATPEAFSPPLTSVDALVRSLTFGE